MKEKLGKLSRLMKITEGFDTSVFEETFLREAVRIRGTTANCSSVEEYSLCLEQNPRERKEFVDSLHIRFSEFFRNPLTYSVLERILFPLMLAGKEKGSGREIRIWSAACAEGQEVYSLSMLLNEMLIRDDKKVKFRIFASDREVGNINLAREGRYTSGAVANLSLKRVNQWFTRQGNSYTVKPELKQNIDFSVFDLLDEQLSFPAASIFGDFDLVICANLLFYYKPQFQEKILEKAGQSLSQGGYLVVDEAERAILMKLGYVEVYPASAIFRKK